MSYYTDRYNLSKLAGQSLGVIQCGIQICHPSHSTPKLLYDHYAIHFILEGKGIFIGNGTRIPLCAGQGFLIFPNTSCSYIADDSQPWKYVYAIFSGADDDTLVHNAGLYESSPTFDFPLDDDMLSVIYSMHRAGKKNEALGYDVTGYFLLAMSRLIKVPKRSASEQHGKQYVTRAKKYIEDNYNKNISIADVASDIKLDRTYLYRLFIRYERISPSEYLLNTRLNAAARLLENPKLTIGDIADCTGFFNLSYFYRRFLQKYGSSPGQYRKKKE